MAVISEVHAASVLLDNVVERTRPLVDAASDGRAYLQRYHRDTIRDVVSLLTHIRRTVAGLHVASRIVTDFDFAVDGRGPSNQPARFTEYLVRFEERAAALAEDVSQLNGSGVEIVRLCQALGERSNRQPVWTLLGIGDSDGTPALQLTDTLLNLYGNDERTTEQVTAVLDGSKMALVHVREALRVDPDDAPANVDAAASLLHEQAEFLRPHVERVAGVRADLEAEIDALS